MNVSEGHWAQAPTPAKDYEKMIEELKPLLIQQADIMAKMLKVIMG